MRKKQEAFILLFILFEGKMKSYFCSLQPSPEYECEKLAARFLCVSEISCPKKKLKAK